MTPFDVFLQDIPSLSQDLRGQFGFMPIRNPDRRGDEGDFQRLFHNSAKPRHVSAMSHAQKIHVMNPRRKEGK